jgi:hypothetical protein
MSFASSDEMVRGFRKGKRKKPWPVRCQEDMPSGKCCNVLIREFHLKKTKCDLEARSDTNWGRVEVAHLQLDPMQDYRIRFRQEQRRIRPGNERKTKGQFLVCLETHSSAMF